MTPDLVRVPEAARRLGVSKQAVYKRINRKQVPTIRIGASVYIDWDKLMTQARKAG